MQGEHIYDTHIQEAVYRLVRDTYLPTLHTVERYQVLPQATGAAAKPAAVATLQRDTYPGWLRMPAETWIITLHQDTLDPLLPLGIVSHLATDVCNSTMTFVLPLVAAVNLAFVVRKDI